MYGIKNDLNSLPQMPIDGDTWSIMHSWAMPTRSFLEFVMFSRFENLHFCLCEKRVDVALLNVYFSSF